MAGRSLLAAAALCGLSSGINPGGFPNSILQSPRGWRSWNAVAEDVTQAFITRQVDALAEAKMTVSGAPTSLLDLGFDRVGIDAVSSCFAHAARALHRRELSSPG